MFYFKNDIWLEWDGSTTEKNVDIPVNDTKSLIISRLPYGDMILTVYINGERAIYGNMELLIDLQNELLGKGDEDYFHNKFFIVLPDNVKSCKVMIELRNVPDEIRSVYGTRIVTCPNDLQKYLESNINGN